MKWMWYKKRWFPSFTEFIYHKDQIHCYPVQDGESLARYLVQEVQLFGEVHPDLLNHIDYASIGRELETSENYLFTDNGIFLLPLKGGGVTWKKCGLHCQLRQNTMRANW